MYLWPARLWFLLGLAVFIASGCISDQKGTDKQVFEFYSGGAYHFEGHGEWQIKLDNAGSLAIRHDVRGEVTPYGPFSLTEPENSELWQLIRAARIEQLSPPQRPGVPDEVQYTFKLEDETGKHVVEIWVNDARQDEAIMTLVDRIGVLIEQHTGQKPALK